MDRKLEEKNIKKGYLRYMDYFLRYCTFLSSKSACRFLRYL